MSTMRVCDVLATHGEVRPASYIVNSAGRPSTDSYRDCLYHEVDNRTKNEHQTEVVVTKEALGDE